MSLTPLAQNAARPSVGSNPQASPEKVAADGKDSTAAEIAKKVAAFSVSIQEAIDEKAAKLFDEQAEKSANACDRVLASIDKLRSDCTAMASEQADSLRQVAATLRGTSEA